MATTPLQVGIAGAGIAGLSAAIGLAQAGHKVDVYEKSRFKNEVGAAINVCPNASRVLAHWGFDFDQYAPTVAKNFKVTGVDGKVLKEHAYDYMEERYGATYYYHHRVDLHNGLKEMAIEAGATIHTDCEVLDLDCDSGRIWLKGGRERQCDVVVIADGVHSRHVKSIEGYDAKPQATGHSIYRFLIPIDALWADPKTRPFIESSADSGLTIRSVDDDTRIVHYPCRNNTMMNFAAIHPNHLHAHKGPLVEDFDADGDVAGLVRVCEPLGESVTEVCKKAKELKLWPLLFREPLEKWHLGKAILIGDAAHPMLPHQGQGGCQAIEDGAALGILLADAEAGEDVQRRLALVEDVRKWRTSTMQYMSNAGQDKPELTAEKVRQVIRGGKNPQTLEEISDFNFGHNVIQESNDALKAFHDKSEVDTTPWSDLPGGQVFVLLRRMISMFWGTL